MIYLNCRSLVDVIMNDIIIKDVRIKCNKCGRDIKFKVHYDCSDDNKYIKLRLDDACVCSCNGAYKQYSTEYENMDNEK